MKKNGTYLFHLHFFLVPVQPLWMRGFWAQLTLAWIRSAVLVIFMPPFSEKENGFLITLCWKTNRLGLLSSINHIFQVIFLVLGAFFSFSALLWLLWFIWKMAHGLAALSPFLHRDITFLSRRTSVRSKGWTGEQLPIQVLAAGSYLCCRVNSR